MMAEDRQGHLLSVGPDIAVMIEGNLVSRCF